MICNCCNKEVETCDSCGDSFKVGENIKCTEKLGHGNECEQCFDSSYEDAEVEE